MTMADQVCTQSNKLLTKAGNAARVEVTQRVKGADHSAVTPVATGVCQAYACPGGVRQQPHLRRGGVHAIPRVHP